MLIDGHVEWKGGMLGAVGECENHVVMFYI